MILCRVKAAVFTVGTTFGGEAVISDMSFNVFSFNIFAEVS